MPVIAASVKKSNALWLKMFNKRMEEKTGLKIGVSMIIDTILFLQRSNEKELENTLVALKTDKMKSRFLKKNSIDKDRAKFFV